jgi:two-component system NtrC family sensor kinase
MASPSDGSRTRYWMLLIISVSVIPVLLISTIILYEFRRAYHDKVGAHLAELVGKHKQAIDGFLAAKLGDIRVLAGSFTFEELSREEFLQERLAALQQAYDPVFVDLGVIDVQGIQVAYAGPFRLGRADYSDAGWFQEAMQREYFISDVFPGLRGLPHFIVAVRSVDRDGQTWILRATVDFVAFNNLVEKIRIGQTGFAFILNEAGDFQTGPSYDLMLDPTTFHGLLDEKSTSDSRVQVIERDDEAGQRNIYVAARLKDGNWLLVYQQATSEAFAEFRHARNVTLLIILLGGIVNVPAAYFLARKMLSAIAEAERQTQIMSKQIVETGKLASVGELAAGIAHEINNPVAIMVEEAGWIEDLLEDKDCDGEERLAELRRALEQIRNQGGRCKQITHKLLSFARKTDTRLQEVNLYDLVEEMVALSAQRARYSNVEISTTLQSNMPTIHASASELQQLLLNVINNALDAMEQAGGSLEITVKLVEGNLWIHVADTGPGIPEANLERIFDPFFTTKPVGKGTGLGLSICYGIVTKMGGEIDARSTIDVGTTFRIRIPVEANARTAGPASSAAGGGSGR